MGQANSRQRTAQRPQEPTQDSVTESTSSPRTEISTEDAPATSKRSRRASVRRSILGLLPSSSSSSSSSSRATKDSAPSSSEPSKSLRKRWRSSRRFSKAPAHLSDLAEATQSPSTLDGDGEVRGVESQSGNTPSSYGAHASSRTSHSPSATPGTSRPSSSRLASAADDKSSKQSRGATSRADPSSEPAVPVPAAPTTPAPTHPTTEDIRREVAEFLTGQPDTPAATPSDDATSPSSGDASEPPSTSGDAADQQQGLPNHFPPSGTLVVVQGVVNTTDTPHAAAASQPAPPATNPLSASSSRSSPAFHSPPTITPVRRRASSVTTPRSSSRMHSADGRQSSRNRLSSFIRPGRGGSDSSSHAHTASTPDALLASSSRTPSDSSESTTESTPSTAPETPTPAETTAPSRGLSPGSIDVLGTLLSVAAAATAASLFSPGLSQNNSSTAPPSPLTTARPLSPTPTAGLGALGGLGAFPGLGLNPGVPNATNAPQQENRDRIRNVWESIRERVGLNPRNTPAASTPALPPTTATTDRPADDTVPAATTGTTADRNQRMRPSEMMLAEMARALNAGLGLAGGNNAAAERRPGTADAANGGHVLFPPIIDAGGSMPPEGSFERFLANLQSDLRNILSEDSAAQDASETQVSPAQPTPAHEADASHGEEHDHADEELPGLETDSESGSESDFHDADEEVSEEAAEVEHPDVVPTRPATPIPSPSALPFAQGEPAPALGQTSPGPRGRERPAINLWRVYRFDPIPANQAQEHAARANPAAAATGTSAAPSPSFASTASSAASSDASRPSGASSPETPEPREPASEAGGERETPDSTGNVVVPVIVVGLQSVDFAEHDEPEDEPGTASAASDAAPSDHSNVAQDGVPAAARPSTPRGRTWQSRAANALRTWRPGRRGSRTRRNAQGAGTRTFLIYVIGGYYPPNHQMATGPDNLDSYEALWELAELLGQVKPPTATSQDIDNSGLQIIKASEMSKYEEDGKIASNCVDRCLVCLDDYEPEEEVRVMSCRHAFHKNCVDKWLTTGRNNCPACRTKGVSVSGDPPPTPS